ncbi:hypothetical protein X742_23295 [Mesorhizobium sp. LNHC232B00]|nr:hypothetical protein X742_23295 [Mesorhizobium sp. LNHC232B00]
MFEIHSVLEASYVAEQAAAKGPFCDFSALTSGGNSLPIQSIYTYLVYPGKGADEIGAINGSAVPLQGKLFDLLEEVYLRSDNEYTIDIAFSPGADGTQTNPCRALLINHLTHGTIDTGRLLAERLAQHTTKRSGLGLLFLVAGQDGQVRKIVVSRFPAHSAVLAEAGATTLTLAFLERVFMRNAYSYKAVVYQHTSLTNGFWTGRAVDKQIESREREVSQYWINDFLDSGLRTTPTRGTRRLALALKAAVSKAKDVTVKSEIASAVTLGPGMQGQTTSVNGFIDHFHFSEPTRNAILAEIKDPAIQAEKFVFDAPVFTEQVPYRTVELSSGAVLTAPSADFDEVFTKEPVHAEVDGEYKYSTVGSVVTEKIARSK